MVAEAPATHAGSIRLKTRTIEKRDGKRIFLFFIATPIILHPKTETSFVPMKGSPFVRV